MVLTEMLALATMSICSWASPFVVRRIPSERPHGLDACSGKIRILLQLLHDALALLLAWNPSNDMCGLRYALGGVIRAQ